MAFVTSSIRSFKSGKAPHRHKLFFANNDSHHFISKHNFVNPQSLSFSSVSYSKNTFNINNRSLFNNYKNFTKKYSTEEEKQEKEVKEKEEEEEEELNEENKKYEVKTRFEDQDTVEELQELEKAESTFKTSTPWTVLPTTAKKNVTFKDVKQEKRFYLQTVYDEAPDPLYWHPPLVKGSFDEKLVLLIKDFKLDEAKVQMRRANQAGRPYEEWMYTLLIYQYAHKKLIFEAKGLFVDAIKNSRFEPSPQLYHSLLYAYCLNRDIEGAQFLLEEMRARKVEITPATYEIFLSFKNPVYQYVEELIRVMKETDNLNPTGLIWSHLVDSYRRSFNYEKAIDTFHKIPRNDRDLSCIHAIMNVYFDKLEVAKAEYFFRQTIEENSSIRATARTWSYYLSFYERHGDYRAADALVDRMRDCGYLVSRDIHNQLIRSRFNGDNYHYAIQGYEDLLAKHKIPNADTYAVVLDSLIASDQLDKAREVLAIAKKRIGFTYEYRTNLITSFKPKIQFSKNPPKVG